MEQIKVEEVSNIKRKILVQVNSDAVEEKISEFFKKIQKEVVMSGFRKGKVPVNILRSKLADEARKSVSQTLLSENYAEAVKNYNLNPVSNPLVDGFTKESKYPGQFDTANNFSATVTVEVLPTIDPTGYVGMTLSKPSFDEAKLIQERVESYQEQFAERSQVTDRGAQNGDMLVVDFKGYLDGEEFDGGSATNHTIDSLGSANFIPGFEEQLVGMKTGETKTIDVTFPEDYGLDKLAGKLTTFDVTVNSIVESKKAELNDDLALMAGFESLEEFESKVKDEVLSAAARQNKSKLEAEIVKKLLEVNKFEVPESLVHSEQHRLAEGIYGQSEPQPSVLEALKSAALLNVQKALLFDAIYNKETELEIGPEELDGFLEEHAARNEKTKDEFVSMLYNANQMDAFMGVLKTSKVVDFIVNSAKDESEESNGSSGLDSDSNGNA